MQHVLITGATGFIGFDVVAQLAEKNVRPRLFVRRGGREPLLRRFPAEIVQGDLNDPASLVRAVEGIDTVIHLGARAVFEEYNLVRPTIVEGSRALIRAACDAGVERFVFASSMLVYSGQEDAIDDTTAPHPCCGYGRAKVEAEQILARAAEDGGMRLAVLRLPHVYGARDLIFREVRRGRVMFPGHGRNLYAHLHVRDAARVLIGAAERNWAGTLPVADDRAVSWRTFFDEIHAQYPHFSVLRMPQWLALAGMAFFTPFRRLQRHPSLYTPDAVRAWNMNLHIRPGLAWDEIGLRPEYPTITQGISAVMEECVAFRWVHSLDDRSASGR